MKLKSSRLPTKRVLAILVILGAIGLIGIPLNQWGPPNVPLGVGFIAAVAITIVMIAVMIGGYRYKWGWTGFTSFEDNKESQKTLWDWMQLLIVPAVLAVGAFLLDQAQNTREQIRVDQRAQTDRELAEDRAREAVLETYLDRMSGLLLDESLSEAEVGARVRQVARARTLTALRRLDGERKGVIGNFLSESQLINSTSDKSEPIISLAEADLGDANLVGADLRGANLGGADLVDANLGGADLGGADLSDANLGDADLGGADLGGANLRGAYLVVAYLRGANLHAADLSDANLHAAYLVGADLRGANLGGADLVDANLGDANLGGADLRGANLHGANLRGADLGGANLRGAYLVDANLRGANLRGANLRGAKVTEEQLAMVGVELLKGATKPDGSLVR